MAKAWTKHVAGNKRFRFTAKLWRGFTHERNATPADEAEFKAGIEPLMEANRLGALLLKFPISFKNTPEERTYLLGLHRQCTDYPLVLEVRNWNTLEMLAELGIGFCNIDQPRFGASLRATAEATSDTGYVRLHGRSYKEWFALMNTRGLVELVVLNIGLRCGYHHSRPVLAHGRDDTFDDRDGDADCSSPAGDQVTATARHVSNLGTADIS
jgi:uncharacterized protein YecE (DUF72 family)